MLFLSYSFGIETTNTFIHSRSSLESHTRFQTTIDKVYTHFQTETAQKHTLWEGTYLYGLYKVILPQVSWYLRRYSVTNGSRDGFLPHLLVRPKTTPSEP